MSSPEKTITLEATPRIVDAEPLLEQLRNCLSNKSPTTIDLSQVESVDTCILQILIAALAAYKSANTPIEFTEINGTLAAYLTSRNIQL